MAESSSTPKSRKLHSPPSSNTRLKKPPMPDQEKEEKGVCRLGWKSVVDEIATTAIFKEAMRLAATIPMDTIRDLYSIQNSVDDIKSTRNLTTQKVKPTPKPTEEAQNNVPDHLGSLPSLSLMDPTDTYNFNYAITKQDGSICIGYTFFEEVKDIPEDTAEFAHASFFFAVLLLHEASHSKVWHPTLFHTFTYQIRSFHNTKRTPPKVLDSKYRKRESGYVEEQLLGHALRLSVANHVLVSTGPRSVKRLADTYLGLSTKNTKIPSNWAFRPIQPDDLTSAKNEVAQEFGCAMSEMAIEEMRDDSYTDGFHDGREEGIVVGQIRLLVGMDFTHDEICKQLNVTEQTIQEAMKD